MIITYEIRVSSIILTLISYNSKHFLYPIKTFQTFVESLNKLELETRNYDNYYREFKKSQHIVFQNDRGLMCHLQKLL